MKTLKIILFLTIISCFTFSCRTDDVSSTEDNKTKIIGTWLKTSETKNDVSIQLDKCKIIAVITSTQIKYNTYYGENCSVSNASTSNYTIDGNKLIITGEGGKTSTIATLNSTTLTVKGSYTVNGTTIHGTETYTKQ